MRRIFLASSLTMASQGCGEVVGSTSPGKDEELAGQEEETEDDVESKDDVESEDDVQFLVPIAPVREGALLLDISEDAATGQLTPNPDLRLRLAFGKGYPDAMSFALSSILFSDSGPVPASAFVLESAIPRQKVNGIEASVGEDNDLRLKVYDAGIHLVELAVRAEFAEAAPSALYTFPLTVAARAVAGVEWSTCLAPIQIVSGSRPTSSRLNPLDDAGIPFEPLNTMFDRGADIIVRARAGSRVEAPSGLDSLTVTGPSQTVSLRSNYSELTSFQLIQAEEIDSLQPSFICDQGGPKGGSAGLKPGGAIALDLKKSPYISAFPGARAGGRALCGGPDPKLFELRSATPKVCAIEPDGCAVRGCKTREYVPAVAAVLAPGRCELELSAPTLAQGAGLAASFFIDIGAL